ncbi:MAG: transcription antitermination factor NusB [Actinobacteria bacterium]|nr:transcription antitermination factor NusB [Actinomycetota bacterium]
MRARTKARKLALDVLYQAELRGVAASVILDELGERSGPVGSYARELVTGVSSKSDEIDATIASLAKDWSLDRMPAIDRNLLRIAVFEIGEQDEIPPGVAISESVALAKELSTAESPNFINGVLGALVKQSS